MTEHNGRTAAHSAPRATKTAREGQDTTLPVIHTSEAMGIIARHMSERELQDNVIALARTLGWRTYDSRRSDPGFPDLVMVRGDVLIVAELKRQRRYRVSAAQDAWLAALDRVARAYLWQPSDWLDGTIERVLRGDA